MSLIFINLLSQDKSKKYNLGALNVDRRIILKCIAKYKRDWTLYSTYSGHGKVATFCAVIDRLVVSIKQRYHQIFIRVAYVQAYVPYVRLVEKGITKPVGWNLSYYVMSLHLM
jgi:hypothetical protein